MILDTATPALDAKPVADDFAVSAPKLTLPKGGGAIRGMGESFSANALTGTASLSVPVFTSPGRGGFGPQLALSYDSGAGNGPFGFGWQLSAPVISRRTDKGLPRYDDADESDIFILSGAEDLVPELTRAGGEWRREIFDSPDDEPGYVVRRYRPRGEGLFARIERWTERGSGISHWRSISRDNVTTLYGVHADARIADPHDPTRIFSWMVSESRDDKGNLMVYGYKAEDGGAAQRYLKRIQYGNRTPWVPGEDSHRRQDWMFEVVLDYGEHDPDAPTPADERPWAVRADPFSSFRATFEVRTWRLCHRILMFHHFPAELGGVADYPVRATSLTYRASPVATQVESIRQTGFVRQADGQLLARALPGLSLGYTEAHLDPTVHEVDAASLAGLPEGVDGARYQWLDLDNEGLSGILSEQGGAWFYKSNLGAGAFGPPGRVTPRPSLAALAGGNQQWLDLAGEGRLDLVAFDGPASGFYPRDAEGGWRNFTPFRARPNVDVRDPNLRFLDLTGDGLPDLLISEDTVWTWYASRGREGYAPAQHTAKARDEAHGPRLVFADAEQTLFITDMSGDGLADLVRIRFDEICYWPNLGYGRFGARVAMANTPVLERPDLFDPRRIRLADIDGSGTTDLIYIAHDGVVLYFNQSGNGWSAGHELRYAPIVDNLSAITAMDLLGNGTSCLVWSSPLCPDGRRPLRYIDLMGGRKPYLLNRVNNHLGAETSVSYAASTRFYVEDREAGRPWVTRLPFPVQVVERVVTHDQVSDTRLVSSFRYRHGYYDGVEREFRGFAYVEQRDAESIQGEFDLPPVLTRTWYHTGALGEGGQLEAWFKNPAHHEYFCGDPQAVFLPDSGLPDGLSDAERREAARALKGSILRQEVYAEDGGDKAGLPYSVSGRNYQSVCLQPRAMNRHAVFFAHASQTLDYHYERQPADPRISHTLTLEVDRYGNVLRSVAIGYARRSPEFDAQALPLATVSLNRFTNAVNEAHAWRTPQMASAATFELTSPALAGARPLSRAQVDALLLDAETISFEHVPVPGRTQQRRIAETRVRYRRNDLAGLLPAGELQSRALPGERYKLTFTPGLFELFAGKATPAQLEGWLTGPDARFRRLDDSGALWAVSGRIYYSPDGGASPEQERAYARMHFFMPLRFEDPFGNRSTVSFDRHRLLPVETRDAVGNHARATNDYRVLQAEVLEDCNGNRTQVRFDALGLVVGTAVQGKAEGPVQGDSFDMFTVDLSPEQIRAWFDADDPQALAPAYLGSATSRMLYDLSRWPLCAATIARETHVGDLAPGEESRLQLSFLYSDGMQRLAQTRTQAEPDAHAQPAARRWIATGATVYDNKGNPVRKYEPFFSAHPFFGIERHGVSDTLFYDAQSRHVATLHPDHSWQKIVFDPWRQITWDACDTAELDPARDPDVGPWFRRLPVEDYLPTWFELRIGGALGEEPQKAAQSTVPHAGTPTVAYADTLGRAFLTLQDNGAEGVYRTRTVLDIQGRTLAVIDALGRTVAQFDFNVRGDGIHQASMEAGERWTLDSVDGQPLRTWNSLRYAFRTEYDALRRPLHCYVSGGEAEQAFATEVLFERTIYGDSAYTGLSHAEQRAVNLRGKTWRHFDGAGLVTTDRYDFKGNPLHNTRQFTREYRHTPDWARHPALEPEVFASSTVYDALNRAVRITAPDASIYRPAFDQAGLLARVDVNLRGAQQDGAPVWSAFVCGIDYNARGQRLAIRYGNGVHTRYRYDPETFRLLQLHSARPPAAPASAPGRLFVSAGVVQDLHYTYDPVGNIVHIRDHALHTVFHANQEVRPENRLVYDALYRLTEASGREQIGQTVFDFLPPGGNRRDYPFTGALESGDLQALQHYCERYAYDPVGNLEAMQHQSARHPWRRHYHYDEASQIEAGQHSNRLSRTTLNGQGGPVAESYGYDAQGQMTRMTHLARMDWNFGGRMSASARQVSSGARAETTYYVYDQAGQRARKVTLRANGKKKSERFYLGGFELYREFAGNGGEVSLARETLHVMDNKQRIALCETLIVDAPAPVATPQPALRFQLSNHAGSACIELDHAASLITCEEYTPYGCSSLQAGASAAEVRLKRYRYIGKERDEETGLGYHGARYYAPWLGRWTSSDPSGLSDGVNTYAYVNGNPVVNVDLTGDFSLSWTDVAIGAGIAILGVAAVALTAGAAAPFVVPAAATFLGVSEATVVTGAVVIGTTAGAVSTAHSVSQIQEEINTGVDPNTGAPISDEQISRQIGGTAVGALATLVGARLPGGGGGGTTSTAAEFSFAADGPGGFFGSIRVPVAAPAAEAAPALPIVTSSIAVGSVAPALMMSSMGGDGAGGSSGSSSSATSGDSSSGGPPADEPNSTPADAEDESASVGTYRSQAGHHVHQSASYSPGGPSATGNPNHMDAVTIDLEGHPSDVTTEHGAATATQRSINQAVRTEGPTSASVDVANPQPGGISSVEINSSGNGTLAPEGNPYLEDVKAYYSLRAANASGFQTPDEAAALVCQSSDQLATSGTEPVRVPSR